MQLLVTDLGARLVWFWSHSMNTKFTTTPSVTTGQAAAIARECGGQPHQSGNDRLAEAINEAAPLRYDTWSSAHQALASLPGVYAIEITKRERTVLHGDKSVSGSWSHTASAIHTHIKANAHVETRYTLHEAVCAVLDSYRRDPLGTKADIAAAEDVVDPSRALPLTSIGPSGIGGEYQEETCADCGRPSGMHLGKNHRCATEKEEAQYDYDINEA